MICSLQALNKMCNEQVSDAMSKGNANVWFLGWSKCTLMRCTMHDTKATTVSTTASVSVPGVPLGRLNSDKAKLEMAWQSSPQMFDIGKPLLAPAPMASNVSRWVTFGPTMAAAMPPATVATPAPVAATTTLTVAMASTPATVSCQDKITAINGTTHHSVNTAMQCHVSQQVNDGKVCGALVDGGGQWWSLG